MNGIENVILVVVDALRADRLGREVGGQSITPNLDALSSDGTSFRNAFTCASNTDPAVTALLTGRYPLHTVFHHGKLVTDREKRRAEATTPLPSVLRNEGWNTVAVGQPLGRWHARGFRRYPDTSVDERTKSYVMNAVRDIFGVLNRGLPSVGSALRSIYNATNPGLKPRVVMQDYDPLEIMSHIGTDPFFGFVHLMDTHMPYLGTTEDFDRLLSEGEYPDASVDEFFDGVGVSETQRDRVVDSLDTLGLVRPGELLALYDAAVCYVDRKIGRLIGQLKEADRWDETALFVTADHGESILEHGIYLDHHGLFDEVFRVPLISDQGTGDRIPDLVQTTDLAPTILDLLGVDGPEMDGHTLLPLLSDRDGWEDRRAVFAEEAYTERRTGVRSKGWKYVWHVPDGTMESERGSSLKCAYCDTIHGEGRMLFDLDTDTGEEDNVYDDCRDVGDELESLYETFTEKLIGPSDDGEAPRYDHEQDVLNRLEAIGYR